MKAEFLLYLRRLSKRQIIELMDDDVKDAITAYVEDNWTEAECEAFIKDNLLEGEL